MVQRRHAPAPAATGEREASALGMGMARILVVDDDSMVREALRALLTVKGHDVVLASDGRHAMAACAAMPVDLAIVDILMPDKDGIETIREVRRGYPRTRIIAISGGSQVRDTDFLGMAEKLGADRIFQKPVEPRALLGAVADCLTPPDVEPRALDDGNGPTGRRIGHLRVID